MPDPKEVAESSISVRDAARLLGRHPETIRRWKISARTSGGTTASTPPAFISVGEVVVSVTKPAMMMGIVFEFSVEVNSNA